MIRIFLISLFLSLPAFAQMEEKLANPMLESRAQSLYTQLRCVVCQNQSIADSNADLAKDLRALVRHRLESGSSDTEIINYIHTRYGDFVLLKPPLKPVTWGLWLGPFMVLLFGGIIVWRVIAPKRTKEDKNT